MTLYHDSEWGVPLHDDPTLLEFLVLEGAQAGLSWETILRKRARYQKVFHGFDPESVARLTPAQIEKILNDPGIVRNRAKIESAVGNARAFLQIRGEFESFDRYVWRFVGGKTIDHRCRRPTDVPALSSESQALSADLRRRGFRFAGPTICYAFMQAVGMVNDHLLSCDWHDRVKTMENR